MKSQTPITTVAPTLRHAQHYVYFILHHYNFTIYNFTFLVNLFLQNHFFFVKLYNYFWILFFKRCTLHQNFLTLRLILNVTNKIPIQIVCFSQRAQMAKEQSCDYSCIHLVQIEMTLQNHFRIKFTNLTETFKFSQQYTNKINITWLIFIEVQNLKT